MGYLVPLWLSFQKVKPAFVFVVQPDRFISPDLEKTSRYDWKKNVVLDAESQQLLILLAHLRVVLDAEPQQLYWSY